MTPLVIHRYVPKPGHGTRPGHRDIAYRKPGHVPSRFMSRFPMFGMSRYVPVVHV